VEATNRKQKQTNGGTDRHANQRWNRQTLPNLHTM